MATIGVIDIAMRASSDQFAKGLQKGGGALKSFATNANILAGKSTLTSGLKQVVEVAQNLGGKLGKAVSPGLKVVGEGFVLIGQKATAAAQPAVRAGKLIGDSFKATGQALTKLAVNKVEGLAGIVGFADDSSLKRIGGAMAAIAGKSPALKAAGAAIGTIGSKLSPVGKALGSFGAGLGKAVSGLGKIGGGIARIGFGGLQAATKAAASGMGKLVGAAQGVAGKLSGMFGPAIAQAGLFGAALAGTVATGLAALATSSARGIDELNDNAAKLGTTTEALGALGYAAKLTGSDAESLQAAMKKMNANIGDAAHVGGPAAQSLQRLGLDAKQLAQMDPSQAFTAIVAGFQKIPNQADRAALAMDVFGKGGTEMLATIQAGPAELARLTAEFNKLGGAVSGADASKVGAAWDAIDRAGVAMQGIGNKIAVAVAPFIEAAADAFAKFASEGIDAGALISGALDLVGTATGFVGDVISAAGIAWQLFEHGATYASKACVDAIGFVGGAIDAVTAHIPGLATSIGSTMSSISETMAGTLAAQSEDLSKSLMGPSLGDKARALFDKIRAGGLSAATGIQATTTAIKGLSDNMVEVSAGIKDLTDKLKIEVATFGMSSGEVDIYKLKLKGASEEQLSMARSLTKQLKGLEDSKKAQDKMKEDAKSLIEATRTPLQKYQEELEKVAKLQGAGLLTKQQAGQARSKAKGEFDDSASEQKGPALLKFGSEELRSAILQRNNANRDEPIKQVADAAKSQVSLQQQMVEQLKRLGGNLTDKAGSALAQLFTIGA